MVVIGKIDFVPLSSILRPLNQTVFFGFQDGANSASPRHRDLDLRHWLLLSQFLALIYLVSIDTNVKRLFSIAKLSDISVLKIIIIFTMRSYPSVFLHAIFVAEVIIPQHPERMMTIKRILGAYSLHQINKTEDHALMLDRFAALLDKLFQPQTILVETPCLSLNSHGQRTSDHITSCSRPSKGA
jgi:hypothetical protein